MIVFRVVTYSAEQSSAGLKPAAKVVNWLLNLIYWAWLILSLKLISCALYESFVAGIVAKSEDTCNVSEHPAFYWFGGKPGKSTIVRCF
jgi:hypothetical protein